MSQTNEEHFEDDTVTLQDAIRAVSDARRNLAILKHALQVATEVPDPNVIRTATRLVDTAESRLNAAELHLKEMQKQQGGRRSHRRKRSSHRKSHHKHKSHHKSHHKRKSHRRKSHRRKTHRR